MIIELLKAKIHRATITATNLEYEGSISIDAELLRASGLMQFEKVHVLNLNTGGRLETYVIEALAGSGEIGLNGAAARLAHPGDKVIILAYCRMSDAEAKTFKPRIVRVDNQNRIAND